MKKTAEGHLLAEDGSNYDDGAYKKASNTVDIAILRFHNNQLQILTGKRIHPPYRDMRVLPGGFIDIAKDEDIDDCASRELEEETHVTGIPIRQFKTYGSPFRDPRTRIISTVYYAIVSDEKLKEVEVKGGDDMKETKWLNVNRLPALGFDHKTIVKELNQKIKHDILHDPIAFEFVNKKFTWAELQAVYEIVLGDILLSPNFRRKILSMYDIEETGELADLPMGRKPILLKYKGEKETF